MKKLIWIVFALLLFYIAPANAYYYAGINADAIYSFEKDNNEGNSRGLSSGITLAYGVDRYFGALKLAIGTEDFSGSSNASQDSNTFELTAGYRLTPMLSTYIGYRFQNYDFSRSVATRLNASEQYNSYGIGGAINYPLTRQWLIKTDLFAYYLSNYFKSDTLSNSGSGFSGGTSVGALYRWRDGIKLSLSYRLQYTNASYFTGGALDSLDTGLSFSVGKIF